MNRASEAGQDILAGELVRVDERVRGGLRTIHRDAAILGQHQPDQPDIML